jgi:TM2 domain-containing membrane protein YozV
MFCRNCGSQLDDKAVACTKCGVEPRNGRAFCQACGQPTAVEAVVCTACGVALAVPPSVALKGADKRIPAGICGILLGSLGVHKFILGYTTPGLIMLGVSLITCGWGAIVTGLIGLIEGIIYLTRSDEEFVQTSDLPT